MQPRRGNKLVYLSFLREAFVTRSNEPKIQNALWALGLFLAILVAWQLSVRAFGIADIILPSPTEIFAYLLRRKQLFFLHLWPTLLQTVWGFLLAVIGGVLLAIVVSLTQFGKRAVMPLLVVAQIVPKIAVAPLFMLWFGLGDLSR